MMPSDQVSFDGIVDCIGDATCERIFVENRDLRESPLEDSAAETVELVDALCKVSKRELHEAGDLSAEVFDDKVYVIG